jgi:hypothetical protein
MTASFGTTRRGFLRGSTALAVMAAFSAHSWAQEMLDDNEKLRAEIAKLREAISRLADQDATLSAHGGNVTVTIDATLTDAEREAIEQTIDAANGMAPAEPWTIATLRNLLERMP